MEKVMIQRGIFRANAASCRRKHVARPHEIVHDAIQVSRYRTTETCTFVKTIDVAIAHVAFRVVVTKEFASIS